ncbi:hypothetical protein Q9233_017865 [Columba guinea]|nr:hypothetical protein Q9233_017865 [Columba guinea]
MRRKSEESVERVKCAEAVLPPTLERQEFLATDRGGVWVGGEALKQERRGEEGTKEREKELGQAKEKRKGLEKDKEVGGKRNFIPG